MNFRILAASLVFLFCFACGKGNSSKLLCGSNQSIMSNVATSCAGVVTSSSNSSGNNNASGSNNNGGNNETNSNNNSSNGSNNGVDPSEAGGQIISNLADLFANGGYNPYDVSQSGGGWNGSDAQALIDDFLANGGEIPSQYHIPIFAAGAGDGGGPRVQIRLSDTQEVIFDQFVYDQNFRGGTRVALCDVTGDGTADLVTVPGATPSTPGQVSVGPSVRVFDGRSGSMIGSWYAGPTSVTVGNWVACADLNNDGKADIVVSYDRGGGSILNIYSGADLTGATILYSGIPAGFTADDRKGLTVATGDVDGQLDGNGKLGPEIVVGHASGDSAVGVYKLVGGSLVTVYSPFDAGMGDGVTVGCGDVDADGHADILLGHNGRTGTAVVQVLSGATLASVSSFSPLENFQGPVNLGAAFLQRSASANILTAAGLGGGPRATAFIWDGLQVFWNTFVFDDEAATFRGGISIAGGLAM